MDSMPSEFLKKNNNLKKKNPQSKFVSFVEPRLSHKLHSIKL